MTKREIVARGTARLLAVGVPGAEYDARELFLFASGEELSAYISSAGEEAAEETAARYEALLDRRASREPLQYITGRSFFYGREFAVRPGVLIPRFDTEALIAEVLGRLRKGMQLLDLCTGSGCILITLLLEGPEGVTGLGSDLSETALSCARENAARLKAEASFVKSDLFGQIRGKYDIITVNPPYIPSRDIEGLEAEVRDYEPRTALDGFEDGLHFYREICSRAGDYLKAGGCLAAEIGFDQGEPVRRLMEEAGFQDVNVSTDLSGRDRVVIGVRKDV